MCFPELDQKTLSRAEEPIFCMLNSSPLLPPNVSKGQNSGKSQSIVFVKKVGWSPGQTNLVNSLPPPW